MGDIWKKLDNAVRKGLGKDSGSLSGVRAIPIESVRLLYLVINRVARGITEGQLTLRATGLVYTTLLAIIPLLAFSFSVLKAFGVHKQVEPLLQNFFAPLGTQRETITQIIIGSIDNIKVSILGSIGLILLIYTVISLLQRVESTFNYIWKIDTSRSLARRVSDYTSVIVIGPILIISAMGITTSGISSILTQKMESLGLLGNIISYTGQLIPYIFVCMAFTVIYILVPNTKVRFRSALVGGAFAGILWETSGWAFAAFIASSTRYTAIYSGFAVPIIFMIWLYFSWFILLIGADISFYHQHPQFLTVHQDKLPLSNRLKERLASLIMFLIGHSYYHGRPLWSLESLIDYLKIPVEPVQEILKLLETKGLIIKTGRHPPEYLPGRDIEKITLKELINSIRTAEEDSFTIKDELLSIPEIDRMIAGIDQAIENKLGNETIKNLILSHEDSEPFPMRIVNPYRDRRR